MEYVFSSIPLSSPSFGTVLFTLALKFRDKLYLLCKILGKKGYEEGQEKPEPTAGKQRQKGQRNQEQEKEGERRGSRQREAYQGDEWGEGEGDKSYTCHRKQG